MSDVITYRLAYLNVRVTLCAKCVHKYPHPLGPVEHGLHKGFCATCKEQHGY